MDAKRGVAAAVIVVAAVCWLSACSNRTSAVESDSTGTLADADAAAAPETGDSATATPRAGLGVARHQVPDTSCPDGWSGLVVTADTRVRSDHLDDVVACTDAARATTYVENAGHAVWVLDADAAAGEHVWRFRSGLAETSFLQVARDLRHREAMVPGSVLTVDLPPEEVAWDLDLPLTFGLEAHGLLVAALRSTGPDGADEAMMRRGPEAKSLATCTGSMVDRATAGSLSSSGFLTEVEALDACRSPARSSPAVRLALSRLAYAEVVAREVPDGVRLVVPR